MFKAAKVKLWESPSRAGGLPFELIKTQYGATAGALKITSDNSGVLYATSQAGLHFSKDGGNSWVTKSSIDGLDAVYSIHPFGSKIYAGTGSGLAISSDGGASWINNSRTNGLGAVRVNSVFGDGSRIYAALDTGLAISTNGGGSWVKKTQSDGLGGSFVAGVFVFGGKIYAATSTGVSISDDGGASWVNRTTANGLRKNYILDVYVNSTAIYVATSDGISISTNGGASWVNQSTSNKLRADNLNGVYAANGTIYVATTDGLFISTDKGLRWTRKTIPQTDGNVKGVYSIGNKIYAASGSGLAISNNGGSTWATATTSNGLGSNTVNGVSASGSRVYAATTGGLSVSDDGGITWTSKYPNGPNFTHVYAVNAYGNEVLALADAYATFSPRPFISKDAGQTWRPFDDFFGPAVSGVSSLYGFFTNGFGHWNTVNIRGDYSANGLTSQSLYFTGVCTIGSDRYLSSGTDLMVQKDRYLLLMKYSGLPEIGPSDRGLIRKLFCDGSTLYVLYDRAGLSISLP